MATWKKIIVSGSDAHLSSVTASNSLLVGTNQVITTTQAGTYLTGSFTGSFKGDGTNLTGVTATPLFPSTALTDITNSTNTKFFINDDAGNATSGNKQITYGNLLTDLAGTNLAVESSDSLTLASTITGLTSVSAASFSGSFSGSFQGDGSSLTGIATILAVTASGANSSVNLKTQALTINGTANEVETTISGQTVTIGLPNSVSITQDLTVGGDLTVNGTTTTINTTNLLVEDKFALFASGSDASTDGGIVVQQGATTGYGLGVDASADRWALQNNTSPTATSITPDAYMGVIQEGVSAPVANPVYGGATGFGTIFVQTDGSIWIYS